MDEEAIANNAHARKGSVVWRHCPTLNRIVGAVVLFIAPVPPTMTLCKRRVLVLSDALADPWECYASRDEAINARRHALEDRVRQQESLVKTDRQNLDHLLREYEG